ncbi:hypothetical protein MHZ92_10520 [Sporosarcina sp. ACRSL]|uniref:hypothetical protein n=1 Tax=Sporosarcina sp. ACRSL TaxID=2918215 RepID=UPI001EF59414|nr:hypothetical protein [Sporosarcina sp. ACRSL]MCG7344571.1 hypothetical protein [Sporosarcina sp. ACRSL]
MNLIIRLIATGVIAGSVLTLLMKLVYEITGNKAYVLLYNTDYIPVLNKWESSEVFGITFHYVFCIASVIGLYFILRAFQLERRMLPYFFTYTIGSGVLFFLTSLTDKPPAWTDTKAWFYWTVSHAVYSWIVGFLIIRWIHRKEKVSISTYEMEI